MIIDTIGHLHCLMTDHDRLVCPTLLSCSGIAHHGSLEKIHVQAETRSANVSLIILEVIMSEFLSRLTFPQSCRPKTSVNLIAVITLLFAGCPDPNAAKKQQEAEARHQRELRMTQQTATATATSQVLQSQQRAAQTARAEGFSAGEASGRNAAFHDLEKREERARELGHQSGLIEGELKGHQAGMKEGEAIGHAKAAADEFRKGQKQGEIYGEIKGRSEAEEEAAKKIELAERKGELRGEKLGRIDGVEEGREQQRRESFARIASVVLCVASCFAAILFFVFVHREPGSALAIQQQQAIDFGRDQERRRIEQEQQAEREERLLTLLERAAMSRIERRDDEDDTFDVVGAAS
ncbi:hypothetical protein [Novipirellula rosea]